MAKTIATAKGKQQVDVVGCCGNGLCTARSVAAERLTQVVIDHAPGKLQHVMHYRSRPSGIERNSARNLQQGEFPYLQFTVCIA